MTFVLDHFRGNALFRSILLTISQSASESVEHRWDARMIRDSTGRNARKYFSESADM
jgi:hypothetical protein